MDILKSEYHYMRALLERFGDVHIPASNRLQVYSDRLEKAYSQLKSQLKGKQSNLLLDVIDNAHFVRDESKLFGFVCGFHLASGISMELSFAPDYSYFKDESERLFNQHDRAMEIARRIKEQG